MVGLQGGPTGRTAVDLLCLHRQGQGQPPREQALDFEAVVSHGRDRGLVVATVGYPDRGPSASDLTSALECLQPRLVYWHVSDSAAVRLLRTATEPLPAAPELAGGGSAARHGEDLLAVVPRLAAVVRGEPEATVAAVALRLRRGESWREEAGLTVREGAGSRRTPPRGLIADLDSLACHADDFFTDDRKNGGHRVLLSRGCDRDCLYCGLQTPYREEHGPGRSSFWRGRSPAAVVAEIERFHALGVRKFHLNSFVFFGQDGRGRRQVRQVAEGILERGLDLELRFVTLVRDLFSNLDLLPLLQRAGLAQVTVGIDSGLPRARRTYGIDQPPDQVHACLSALADLGLPFYSVFIFYDPYLTLPEIRLNLRFLEGLRPHYAHMGMPFSYFLDQQLLGSVLRVHQDTPLYSRLVEDGLAERVGAFDGPPRVGMRDPRVGRLFQAYQALNKTLLPGLRPLLWSREAVVRRPDLERLPIDLVERLADLYGAEPELPPQEAVRDIAHWLHESLAPDRERLVGCLGSDEVQRSRWNAFFDALARQPGAPPDPLAVRHPDLERRLSPC